MDEVIVGDINNVGSVVPMTAMINGVKTIIGKSRVIHVGEKGIEVESEIFPEYAYLVSDPPRHYSVE